MDKYLIAMAATRLTFGLVNLFAAWLMWRLQAVESELRINGIVGSIGPFVLIFVSSVGVAGLAGKIPLSKLLLIGAGVFFILWGTR